ncbi:MAG: GTP cyclohydrolase I, partial [Taibaiella sp.]|nr:GTP cyclohydrolase I [Taibaiella sp.]
MSYKKKEEYCDDVTESMKESYRNIISQVGEDPDREGLQKTPERIAKAMQYLT